MIIKFHVQFLEWEVTGFAKGANIYLINRVRGICMSYVKDLRAIVGNRPLILVGSVVIVVDEYGRLLLQQRKFPNRVWGIPGGLMELGESTEEVAQRELYEETRLKCSNLKLITVHSGSDSFIKAENGDEFYVVTTAYYTKDFTGELYVDPTESIDVKFFHFEELPSQIVGSHRKIINEFIEMMEDKL